MRPHFPVAISSAPGPHCTWWPPAPPYPWWSAPRWEGPRGTAGTKWGTWEGGQFPESYLRYKSRI